MQVSVDGETSVPPAQPLSAASEMLRAIAYSMDAFVPGFYLWIDVIRISSGLTEPTCSGTIHSFTGVALVLPGYQIYNTYQGSYDPR